MTRCRPARGRASRTFTTTLYLALAVTCVCPAHPEMESGREGAFVDPRDGREYRTVRLGNLEWFAENLNHAMAGSWCYDDQEEHCGRLGRLYCWQAAMAACPPGWRLPTDEDWRDLERAVHMSEEEIARAFGPRGTDSGERLKAGGDSGFDALLAGHRGPTGRFSYLGASGDFWSATEKDAQRAVIRQVIDDAPGVVRNTCRKSLGMSVRCVRSVPRPKAD